MIASVLALPSSCITKGREVGDLPSSWACTLEVRYTCHAGMPSHRVPCLIHKLIIISEWPSAESVCHKRLILKCWKRVLAPYLVYLFEENDCFVSTRISRTSFSFFFFFVFLRRDKIFRRKLTQDIKTSTQCQLESTSIEGDWRRELCTPSIFMSWSYISAKISI